MSPNRMRQFECDEQRFMLLKWDFTFWKSTFDDIGDDGLNYGTSVGYLL